MKFEVADYEEHFLSNLQSVKATGQLVQEYNLCMLKISTVNAQHRHMALTTNEIQCIHCVISLLRNIYAQVALEFIMNYLIKYTCIHIHTMLHI